MRRKSSWDYRVLQLPRKYSLIQNVKDEIIMSNVWDSIQTFEKESWHHEVWNDKNNVNGNKLRFYRLFKTCIGTEPYVKVVNNRCHRRILSLFRAGSLQLKVETGRYARPPEPLQDRLCIFCDSCQIEDEKHFLFNCCFYSDIRHELYAKACLLNVDFEYLCDIEKLRYLMCNENMVPLLASSLYHMFYRRKHVI